jgi:hypothetical protein
MKSAAIFAFVMLAVMVVGCSTPQMSPRQAFLLRTPDRTNYFRVYEVSPESLRVEEERIVRLTKNFTQTTRQVSTNCPACPVLEAHLSRVESIADRLHKRHVELMQQLENVYDSKTDAILYFHYWAGERQEAGYLVTRDGIVKKRFTFGEE